MMVNLKSNKKSLFRRHIHVTATVLIGFVGLVIVGKIVEAAAGGGTSAGLNAAMPTTTPSVSTTVQSTAEQIGAWSTKYSPTISTLDTSYASLTKDEGSAEMIAVARDCQNIQDAVTSAQAFLPIPDRDLQKEWGTALAYYQSGARDCVKGVSDMETDLNPDLITQAGKEMDQGNIAMQLLSQGIERITK
jgi:hypothetical protein